MYMQDHFGEILCHIGTQHVRRASGRYRHRDIKIYDDIKTFSNLSDITIAVIFPYFSVIHSRLPSSHLHHHHSIAASQETNNNKSEFLEVCFVRVLVVSLGCIEDGAVSSVVCVCIVVSTVKALYEGTLVASRTTAQKVPQRCWRSSAQLATLCLFLATLTIAARCYASSNATHPLVQLNSRPPTLSPIYNSNAHSSKLVLSRLFTTPHQLVQSDTSVILTNSKKLLYNQNFIYNHHIKFRTKRELKNYSANPNRIQSKSISDENSTSFKNSNNNNKPSNTESASISTSNKVFNLISSDNTKFKYQTPSQTKPTTGQFSFNNTNSSEKSDSVNLTRVNADPQLVEHQQNDSNFQEEDQPQLKSTTRPMPPAHAHDDNDSSAGAVSEWGLILVVVLLTGAALGLVTCLLSHQGGTGGASGAGTPATDPHHAAQTPTTAPMLSVVSAGAAAGMGGMDRLRGGRAARELAATRDRQVRLHAVQTDIAINLPHSIQMPDGEEHPFTSRLHIRDAEQESEIYQKCIRPPPNRTVLESESPPPYRSSSAGVLASSSSSSSSSSGSSDWSAGSAPLVVRCHSMSSTSKPISSSTHPHSGQKTDFLQRTVKIFTGKKTTQQSSQPPPAPTLPVVIVPSSSSSSTSRPRRTLADNSRPKPPPAV